MTLSLTLASFFGSIVPMIYFFVRHKVHRVPGGASCPVSRQPLANATTQPTRAIASSNGLSSSSMSPMTLSQNWISKLLISRWVYVQLILYTTGILIEDMLQISLSAAGPSRNHDMYNRLHSLP